MKRLLIALACAALAACAHNPPVAPALPPRVVVPVQCEETIPDRPAMPTDALPDDSKVDPYVQAAAAEIELREGYEVKLRTALEACTKPIQPSK